MTFEQQTAKARYYGRRCTTRSRKTWSKQRLQDEQGWLCDCGNWMDSLFHCSNCRNEPPCGCPCSFCQDPDPIEGSMDDELYDPGELEDVPVRDPERRVW